MACENAVLTPADFDYVRSLAKTSAAIVIDKDKEYLVQSRLSPLAEQEGFSSLEAFIAALRKAEDDRCLHTKTIDALTTNETLFFRDRHPFDALESHILPQLIDARRPQKRLNIWSAAASTGQEAYSIAMLIRNKFPELQSWKISIIGTDISGTVLERARSGRYSQHEINRGLPAPLLIKYFTQSGDHWIIAPEIRSMVQFRNINLVSTWANLPIFDLIFVRNVLIYFDNDTRRSILSSAARHLTSDGFLAMGTAESPMTVTNLYQPIQVGRAVFYLKAGVTS